MDAKRLLALFWLALALAHGRKTNDEHAKRSDGGARETPSSKQPTGDAGKAEAEMSERSYGFKDSAVSNSDVDSAAIDYGEEEPEDNGGEQLMMGEPEMPGSSSYEQLNGPAEMMDAMEEGPRPPAGGRPDIRSVKKVKEVSIISLKPRERNRAPDPVTEQMRSPPVRVVRPLRAVGTTTILVRNRHRPILIARQVPANWIHRHHHHHHHPHHHHKPEKPHHHPHKPKKPKKKHKCKPCKPKKKHHHHKPKKPKKGHCHHPKKPHHKKLIYYAPVPQAMNSYYYGSKVPTINMVQPSNNYAVEESQEHEEDAEEDAAEKPMQQEIEDEVDEEHRLAELQSAMNEPFDEPPDDVVIKSAEVTDDSK